jgi:hypothetical protein
VRRLVLTTLAVIALALAGTVSVHATAPDPSGSHQVWVCKYVGAPGDFETLKPGKQPIIVDVASADAYVGADFADGQTHSFVIDLATDENTGQGETYIGEATCPTPEATSPPPDESATPTVEPSVSPTVEPSSPSSPSPVASTGVPPTPPNTATEETSSVRPGDSPWYWLAVTLFGAAIAYVLLLPKGRRS